jgi:hypothetical protein
MSYNLRIKAIFNEMDTTIVSLNAENADLFGQLLFDQGKFESFFVRNYFNNLIYGYGKELVNNILIEDNDIQNHFVLYTENKVACQKENSKCFFVFSDSSEKISSETKKVLYLLIPTLDMSLDIRAYNKDNFLIFNKFNFYENEAYFIYKYNKTENDTTFFSKVKPVALISNTLKLFLNEAELIEKLNEIKINELTNYQFFKQNAFVISPSYVTKVLIYP